MKLLSCFLLILYPCLTHAQHKPLSVGDRVPDLAFTQTINHKLQTTKLSQSKNKLLILDFWATWCTNCIKKFPELSSLKEKYAASIDILLITAENNSKVQGLFAKLGNGLSTRFPVITNDTVFAALFPHRLLPHYVWLNADRKVIAITGPEEITELNISNAINGKLSALLLKEDLEDFNRNAPLFINGNGGSGSGISNRSTLSRYIPGLPSGTRVTKDSNGCISKILVTNTPVLQLMAMAYRTTIPQSCFQFEAINSNSLLFAGKTDAWIRTNSHTYELMLPPATPEQAYRFMQQDMQRFFGLIARTETRPTPCFVLTADTAILKKHISKNENPVNTLFGSQSRLMCNRSTATLVAFLEKILGRPVIDETGFSHNISLGLPGGDIANITTLQSALIPYGLCLTPAQKMLGNFIIHPSN